jgi:hypothetical protein
LPPADDVSGAARAEFRAPSPRGCRGEGGDEGVLPRRGRQGIRLSGSVGRVAVFATRRFSQ